MKKWAIILIILAALDVVTTHISLSLGSIEANPFFSGVDIKTMTVIKMGAYSAIAYLLFRLKLGAFLIFCCGANAGVVIGNLMAIWTLS